MPTEKQSTKKTVNFKIHDGKPPIVDFLLSVLYSNVVIQRGICYNDLSNNGYG